jgi:aspartate aminotransferase-like enzyme
METIMPGLHREIDPDGLLEYSVVYTDRSVNHMSQRFQGVMNDISLSLKEVYNASKVVIVPGSGTFGMEAVARQFGSKKKALVIRNGWFSFRWSQILEMGKIPSDTVILKAKQINANKDAPFTPYELSRAIARIKEERPDVVFAPHVETSAGLMLHDEYLKGIAEATHQIGGILVVDCIAAGAIWLDMKKIGIDVLISAPQKGWSGSPCCALVMLSDNAVELLGRTTSTSFACDLKKWAEIMDAYEAGGHAYHATMPTDGLIKFRDVMSETKAAGYEEMKLAQQLLGKNVRLALNQKGFKSVAAPNFEAPGVIVCYTHDPEIQTGKKFATAGLQIAAGVPLKCDEPEDFQTFRIGLFGIDKLKNIDLTLRTFVDALEKI